MGRTVKWVTRAVVAVAAVVAGPATAPAQDFSILLDYRVVEGVGGSLSIEITRSGIGFDTDVLWRTVEGSALAGLDFTAVTSGSVHFSSSDLSKTVFVTILDDGTPELVATQQDEVFFVELTSVVGDGTIQRGRASVTIVDDDRSQPGVQFLSVVSDGTSTAARNRLQWRVPGGQPNAPTQIQIRWDKGPTGCVLPNTTSEGTGGTTLAANPPGDRQFFAHPVGAPPEVWCYSVFTLYPAQSSAVAKVKTKTLDSGAGPVKWTHTNSAALPNVAPPTIGQDGIYSVDNDGVLHAMVRGTGAAAGGWPANWNPVALGRIAHNRSPLVPLSGATRLFVGTEAGELHSVDGRTGTINWSRSQAFGDSQLMPGSSTGTQANPALLLKGYGGPNDLLLVGTATGSNDTAFFALNPATGATIDYYPYGPIGPSDSPLGPIKNVYGMAVVDYAANRVYFGAAGGGLDFTLWSLDLGATNSPDLTLTSALTLPWNPKSLGSGTGTMGSLVLRNGWLYLGTGSGAASELHALRISNSTLHSYVHGDGQVKGFPWPDRRHGRLYFSTTNKVHALYHDGVSLAPDPVWVATVGVGFVTMTNPSIVLQRPGTDELYVGDGLGRLVRLNAATGEPVSTLMLDASAVIGAPSLDNSYPGGLLLVGSDKGVIYAVQAGF
jgi:hypothetical protein